jgi:hypothetical protein
MMQFITLCIAIIVTGCIFVSETHAEMNKELTKQHFDPEHVTALSAGLGYFVGDSSCVGV